MDFSPLFVSVKIAFFSTTITFFLGSALAWLSGFTKKAKPLMDSILSLPLVLPPTVTGFFLLMLLGKQGLLGKLILRAGIKVLFTWQGGLIAAVCISLPVMYRTARGAFQQVDSNLLNAARTLGMSEFAIFCRITLPLSAPGVAAGAILSFARSLGEFGATMMVAGNIPGKTQTMAVAVYTAMQSGNMSLAFKWVCILFAISLAILLLMNLTTEKVSSGGRSK